MTVVPTTKVVGTTIVVIPENVSIRSKFQARDPVATT
jgi:hypothetical protein